MAFQNAEAIQKLYVAFFNRPADYYGLEYWDGVVTRANGSTAAVAAEFAKSKEYTDTFAGMDTRNVINTVYKNLFGRSADEAGLNYWYGEVQAGRVTIANAVTSIAAGAQNADKIAYASKVTAATSFTNALDTTDERLGYAGEKANAVAKQFIADVKDEATLATAINPANLDATVNSSIGAGQTAQTYQLTKGLDNVVGTAGNDVIVGSIDNTVGTELNTLSSIDLINGGAGVDTLKIAHAAGSLTLGSLTNIEIVEITSAATAGVTVDSRGVTGVTDLNIVRAAGDIDADAAASTNVGVSLKDVAANTIDIDGGKNVNVALTDAQSDINVGLATAATGAVTISATGAASVNNQNVVLGDIAVTGGATISVTQKATVNGAAIVADGTAEDVVQGNVTIIANAATTDVTVKQDATNDGSASRTAITGATEVATVKFAALKVGESVTVAGLTFTAAKALTAAEVAQAFANVTTAALKPTQLGGPTAVGDTNGSSVAANGTFSGSLTSAGFAVDGVTSATSSWASGAANGDTVTFTGRANTNQTNIAVSSSATTGPTVTTTTEGITSRTAWNDLGVTAGSVAITGGAALKNVTVDGYDGTSGVSGASNAALATVTLANGGSFTVGSAAATLALNATDVDGVVTVAAGTKTLNANVVGANSDVTLVSASADTINVKGDGNVAGDTTAGLGVATAINTSGMTAGSATFTIANGTTTSYTGGAAKDIVTITNGGTATTKAVTLGAGDDTLNLSGTVVLPTATLSGGEGTDIIGLSGASAAAMSLNADFAGKIDGFEKLAITDTVATATTVNMANMDGIKYVVSNNSVAVGTAAVGEQQSFVLTQAGEQQTVLITAGTSAAVAEQQGFTVAGTATAAGTFTVMGVATNVADTTTAAGVASAIVANKAAIIAANPTVADITANGADVTITYTTAAANAGTAVVTAGTTGITVGAVAESRAFDSNAGNITVAGTTIALTAGMSIDAVGAAILAKTADIKAANPNVDTVAYNAATDTLTVTYKASAGNVAVLTATDTGSVGFAATVTDNARAYGIPTGTITVAGATVNTAAGQTIDQLGASIAAQEATIKAANNAVDAVTYDAATDTLVVTYKATAGEVAESTVVAASGINGGSFTETRANADAGSNVPSLTIDKMVNDSTLELVAAGGGVNVKMADASGTADTFNIVTTIVASSLDFGTVNVAGVETIKINGNDAQPVNPANGAASIQTGTLAVNADAATSIVVNGNSHVNLSLGADTKSVATVDASALTGNLTFAANGSHVVTVTGGAGADVLRASVGDTAKADVINGGAGADVLYVGTNGAKLTGGAGNDTFIVSAASTTLGNKEGNTYSEITDFSAGDLLQLRSFASTTVNNVTTSAAADVSSLTKLTATLNESTATFSNFVDAAVKQAGVGAATWFNYKGDLYVVVDSGTDTDTFQNGTDLIVKLTGINGDNLTFNTDYGTAALI